MTKLTATVNPDRASVALVITPTSAVSSVMRHDANGIHPVRFPGGTFPTSNVLQVDDWEAALAGTVTYSSGGASASVVLGAPGPWLVPPLRPSAALPLVAVSGYDAARSSSVAVHAVPGGDPVIALGSLGLRSGSFRVLCADHAVAAHLEDLLGRLPQQMLKVPEHSAMDLYFVSTGSKVSPDPDTGLWELTVEYVETAAPTEVLATWTYAALARAYPTLATAGSAYEDLDALARDDRSL